ncbi:kelch 4 [Fusarium phyllophilum]|uniref:Kelch 4 n=1 Tax=Fusarium phyllophilum TaxID=47803 RepID=A0A8H5MX06_9HYPO|nr:kelch 4 [Fusarium phyllophilum]
MSAIKRTPPPSHSSSSTIVSRCFSPLVKTWKARSPSKKNKAFDPSCLLRVLWSLTTPAIREQPLETSSKPLTIPTSSSSVARSVTKFTRQSFVLDLTSSKQRAEAQTGEIELPDDDPFAVSMMIEYLYHQAYTIPDDAKLVLIYKRSSMVPFPPGTVPLKITRHFVSGDSSANQPLLHPLQTAAAAVPPPEERASHVIPYVNLYVHYKVYALGEKYGIAGLKALVVHKFETEGEDEFKSSSVNQFGYLIHVMKEAYNCTAEGDSPLRDAVVRILKSKPTLF